VVTPAAPLYSFLRVVYKAIVTLSGHTARWNLSSIPLVCLSSMWQVHYRLPEACSGRLKITGDSGDR